MTTPSEPTGIKPTDKLMEDIVIIVSEELRKATATGKTDRGKEWIQRESDLQTPNFYSMYLEANQVEHLKAIIEMDGLTVIVR